MQESLQNYKPEIMKALYVTKNKLSITGFDKLALEELNHRQDEAMILIKLELFEERTVRSFRDKLAEEAGGIAWKEKLKLRYQFQKYCM